MKEARHVTEDGTEYMVELMKPNTHKLSLMLDFDHTVQMLWTKIRSALIITHTLLPQAFLQKYGMPLGINPRLR